MSSIFLHLSPDYLSGIDGEGGFPEEQDLAPETEVEALEWTEPAPETEADAEAGSILMELSVWGSPQEIEAEVNAILDLLRDHKFQGGVVKRALEALSFDSAVEAKIQERRAARVKEMILNGALDPRDLCVVGL